MPPPPGILLLGRSAVLDAAGGEATPRSRKAVCLLAYLALQPGGRARRETLQDLLWSNREQAQAAASLRQALVELRRALAGLGPDLVDASRDSVALACDRLFVDVRQLDRLLEQGTPEAVLEAAGLWHGPLLGDLAAPDPVFEAWLQVERTHRHERLRRALGDALEAAERAGTEDDACRVAELLLRVAPTEEAAWRALIAIDLRHGRVTAARARFRDCREILARELEVKPSAALTALFSQVDRPARPAAEPAEPQPAPARHAAAREAARPARRGPALAIVMRPPTGPPELGVALAALVEDELTVRLGQLRLLSLAIRPEEEQRLDADYVLAIAVAFDEARPRVSIRLRDRESGQHLIVERLEPADPVPFERLRPELARMAVSVEQAIVRHWLEDRGGLRAGAAGVADPYTLWLAADRLTESFEADDLRAAVPLLRQAAATDPGFARPLASLASIELSQPMASFVEVSELPSFNGALGLAKSAVRIDPWDPRCRIMLAWVYMRKRLFRQAEAEFRQALALGGQDPLVLIAAGEGMAHLGKPEVGIGLGERALAIHPAPPDYFHSYLAATYAAAGAHDRALEHSFSSALTVPEYIALRAVLLAETGRREQARAAAAEFLQRAEAGWSGHRRFDPRAALTWLGSILLTEDQRRRESFVRSVSELIGVVPDHPQGIVPASAAPPARSFAIGEVASRGPLIAPRDLRFSTISGSP
ncbi:MAG: BTAD domain-containing putative transcriptional regulator [Dongiaceae bacterium]